MTPLAGTDPALTAYGYVVTAILLAVPAWGALRLIVDHYRQRLAERDPVRGPGAADRRPGESVRVARVSTPVRKERAECCQERALPDGRPVLGFCSQSCIRRPAVWAALQGESR